MLSNVIDFYDNPVSFTLCVFPNICRSEAKRLEIKALKNISSCSITFGKTGMETTAYLRALSEAKGLNVDKHRHQVAKELQKENENDEVK